MLNNLFIKEKLAKIKFENDFFEAVGIRLQEGYCKCNNRISREKFAKHCAWCHKLIKEEL